MYENIKPYNKLYKDFRTRRQWLKLGFKLRKNAKGVLLWSNRWCVKKFVYYGPSEVIKCL